MVGIDLHKSVMMDADHHKSVMVDSDHHKSVLVDVDHRKSVLVDIDYLTWGLCGGLFIFFIFFYIYIYKVIAQQAKLQDNMFCLVWEQICYLIS